MCLVRHADVMPRTSWDRTLIDPKGGLVDPSSKQPRTVEDARCRGFGRAGSGGAQIRFGPVISSLASALSPADAAMVVLVSAYQSADTGGPGRSCARNLTPFPDQRAGMRLESRYRFRTAWTAAPIRAASGM